jgi:hypothetical protein
MLCDLDAGLPSVHMGSPRPARLSPTMKISSALASLIWSAKFLLPLGLLQLPFAHAQFVRDFTKTDTGFSWTNKSATLDWAGQSQIITLAAGSSVGANLEECNLAAAQALSLVLEILPENTAKGFSLFLKDKQSADHFALRMEVRLAGLETGRPLTVALPFNRANAYKDIAPHSPLPARFDHFDSLEFFLSSQHAPKGEMLALRPISLAGVDGRGNVTGATR